MRSNRIGFLYAWIVAGLLLSGCSLQFDSGAVNTSNGERIYFTATSERGGRITYRGGPNFGGMMMGAFLTCAACHGPDGRGGVHWMHMQRMDAPDIRIAALSEELEEHGGEGHPEGEYDLEDFRQAVIGGQHPDRDPLSQDMPRWRLSDADLADLYAFLASLP